MKIRGERECTGCGARWSYYETGQITCPDCGSMQSRGLDERTQHTASPIELDLTSVRLEIDEEPLRSLTDQTVDATREYLSSTGFIHAGELQPLDDTYLAASELRRVATTLGRALDIDEREEIYFLDLLDGTDRGERPDPSAVPPSLAPERGLAITASVETYIRDMQHVFDEREGNVDSVLSALRAHRKRIEALDGDVEPAESEQLVRAVRDLSAYLREGDETALARAQSRFDE